MIGMLRPIEGQRAVFECLPGLLLAAEVVLLVVMNRGGAVGMCGELMKLGGALVRIV